MPPRPAPRARRLGARSSRISSPRRHSAEVRASARPLPRGEWPANVVRTRYASQAVDGIDLPRLIAAISGPVVSSGAAERDVSLEHGPFGETRESLRPRSGPSSTAGTLLSSRTRRFAAARDRLEHDLSIMPQSSLNPVRMSAAIGEFLDSTEHEARTGPGAGSRAPPDGRDPRSLSCS